MLGSMRQYRSREPQPNGWLRRVLFLKRGKRLANRARLDRSLD
jgi:hypothetical protein